MKRFVKFLLVLLCVGLVIAGAFTVRDEVRQRLYPLKYRDWICTYAAENELDPALVLALIKCESSFDPGAVSSVGARGLTQITESTFEWLRTKSKREGDKTLTFDAMFDPETSIRFSCLLLGRLTAEFGTPTETLAAYHAGSSRVRGWLADAEYSSDGKTLEHIPFDDTRGYVRRVLETRDIYEEMYADEL